MQKLSCTSFGCLTTVGEDSAVRADPRNNHHCGMTIMLCKLFLLPYYCFHLRTMRTVKGLFFITLLTFVFTAPQLLPLRGAYKTCAVVIGGRNVWNVKAQP